MCGAGGSTGCVLHAGFKDDGIWMHQAWLPLSFSLKMLGWPLLAGGSGQDLASGKAGIISRSASV